MANLYDQTYFNKKKKQRLTSSADLRQNTLPATIPLPTASNPSALPQPIAPPTFTKVSDIPAPQPLNLNAVPAVPALNIPSNTLGFGGMQNLTNAIGSYGSGVFNALDAVNRNKQIMKARKTLSTLGINKANVYKAIAATNASKASQYNNLVQASLRPYSAETNRKATEANITSQKAFNDARIREYNATAALRDAQTQNAQKSATKNKQKFDKNIWDAAQSRLVGSLGYTPLGQNLYDKYLKFYNGDTLKTNNAMYRETTNTYNQLSKGDTSGTLLYSNLASKTPKLPKTVKKTPKFDYVNNALSTLNNPLLSAYQKAKKALSSKTPTSAVPKGISTGKVPIGEIFINNKGQRKIMTVDGLKPFGG